MQAAVHRLKTGVQAHPVPGKKRRTTARFPDANKTPDPAASSSARQEQGILENLDVLLQ
jgi:hypothetical protein